MVAFALRLPRKRKRKRVNELREQPYFGQVLWAALTIPVSLPLLLVLLFLASICGLTGEFLLWLFPSNTFSKELVEIGNNLASTSRNIFYWCLLKNSVVDLRNKNRQVRNNPSAALQSTQTLVDHVINMKQQLVPLASSVPFTVPRSTFLYGFPKIGFTYQELAAATNRFAKNNIVGEGGFGTVYRGTLQDGRLVAVKCLSPSSLQGPRELFVELDVLSRVHHRHLIQLIGCSITKENSLVVYSYAPKGSLDTLLHGKGSKTIDWQTRVKVALGSAKALAYLHEGCQPRIVHRDLKVSNILLDDNFQPKVSDFGLGKFFPDEVTHVKTAVMGTSGYAAPEYVATGVLNEKCDVYSYGVVLFELVSGRRAINPNCKPELLVDDIKQKLKPALQRNDFSEIVDPRLKNQYNLDELKMLMACAAACTHYLPHERPPINRIALVLGGRLPSETLGSLDNHLHKTYSPCLVGV